RRAGRRGRARGTRRPDLGGRPEIHLGSGPDRGLYRSMAARAACRGRQSRRDKRDTHGTPRGLWRWEVGAARSAIVGSTSRAYRACRAGFASRGTLVARGTTPSRSRPAPTRDMSLGSRSGPGAGLWPLERREQHDRNADGDGCVGDVEGRPVQVAPVEIEEVDDLAVADAIEQVPDRAAQDGA